MTGTIDLTEKLAVIKGIWPKDSWRSTEAQDEARRVWGNVETNDAGVIWPTETSAIRLPGGRTKAEIRLATCPNGWWAMATSYESSGGGVGSYPSVWDRTAYTSREDASAGGIEELAGRFEDLREWGRQYGPKHQILKPTACWRN